MWRTGILVCTALLVTACVAPATRDTDADRLRPPKAEQDLSPGISSAPATPEPEPEKPAPPKAEQELSSGIGAYEDGDYKTAPKLLQSALDSGLLLNSDKVVAHKYLAFMHCAQRRDRLCREEFRKALELDPNFELNPAEAGHPLWGRVFRNIKAEMAKKTPK
jgi:Tfp pilus assembly protein PilF